MRSTTPRNPRRWLRRTFLTAAVVAGAASLGGCVVHARPAAAIRLGPAVVVRAGHVHTDRCGHFQYNGRWYYAAHHVHGRHCGHVHRGGVWILVR